MPEITQPTTNAGLFHSIETTQDKYGATYIHSIVFYKRDVIGEKIHPRGSDGNSFWEKYADRISFESQNTPVTGAEKAIFSPPLSLDEFLITFGNID